MRSYAQYCPVAKASEILGDRWTLLIVREMLGGASGFNELQRGLPGISRSVLTDRMRALERAEVIERRTGPKGRTLEYRLTSAGRDLQPVVQAIGEWGATWSLTEPRPGGARSLPVDRLDGPPCRSQAAPAQPNRGSVRLSRPQAALLDGPRALRGLGLPPASRFRRRPRGQRRHRHALPRLPGTGRAGRRDSSRPADDERPADAATRIRPLVHLERIRPGQPRRRRSAAQPPHGLPALNAYGSPKLHTEAHGQRAEQRMGPTGANALVHVARCARPPSVKGSRTSGSRTMKGASNRLGRPSNGAVLAVLWASQGRAASQNLAPAPCR